jgi:hypothetical protein
MISLQITSLSKKTVCFAMFLDEVTLETLLSEGQKMDNMGFKVYGRSYWLTICLTMTCVELGKHQNFWPIDFSHHQGKTEFLHNIRCPNCQYIHSNKGLNCSFKCYTMEGCFNKKTIVVWNITDAISLSSNHNFQSQKWLFAEYKLLYYVFSYLLFDFFHQATNFPSLCQDRWQYVPYKIIEVQI